MRYTVSLKQNRDFRRLYAKGKNSASPVLAVYCRKNRLGVNRLGITVGGKLGNAVVRNKLRRRIREIYRTHEEAFLPGWDIVVVGRARAVRAPYGTLQDSLLRLADKLGLLRREGTP
ncbi:MAG: ribonuclease P protein component [Clostridiales bacterium]|nr:ribonuclease P protein component [Clostridiales bacterium]